MKKIFQFLSSVLFAMIFFMVNSQALSLPTHLQYGNYNFPNSASQGFYNVDMHVKFNNEPEGGQWGYYAMEFFQFQAGPGGYTGLQKDAGGKKAIFSIWDAPRRETAYPVPGTACRRFGHEGSGTSCIINFDWKAGTEYKLRVWRISNGDTNVSQKWGAWVIDVNTGIETMIGIIELYNAQGLVGYGNLTNTGYNTTLEIYSAPANAMCNDIPYFSVSWKGPFANNGSINPQEAFVNYSTGIGDVCPHSMAFSNGAFSVTQESGKGVTRKNGSMTQLWTGYNTAKYSDADCIMNWAEKNYPQFNQSQFRQRRLSTASLGYYSRDYSVNGYGPTLIADMVDNRLMQSEPGSMPKVLGNLNEFKAKSGCNFSTGF